MSSPGASKARSYCAARGEFLHQLLDPLDQEFLFRRLDQNPRFFYSDLTRTRRVEGRFV
jgi:hypothetical protein